MSKIRSLSVALLLVALVGAALPADAASVRVGAKCSKVGQIKVVGSQELICVKSKTKLLWKVKRILQSSTPIVTPTKPAEITTVQTSYPTDVSWFPASVALTPKVSLSSIPVPDPRSSTGDLMEKSTVSKSNLEDVKLAWRQTTVMPSSSDGSNRSATHVDQYRSSSKTWLTQLNTYIWNVGPNERARYGWIGPWVDYGFDSGIVLPSPDRFQNYIMMIFPERVNLYHITSRIPVSTTGLPESGVEKFLLKSLPLTPGLSGAARSKELAAHTEVLVKLMMDTSPAQNYGFKYTGHGAGAGGLFEVNIDREDARRLLRTLVAYNSGQKFAYYDGGTNCDEATLTTLDDLAPYFDYVLASQFERGGGFSCSGSMLPCWWMLENGSTLVNLDPYYFSSNLSIGQSLVLKTRLFQHTWYGLTDTKKQSLTLFDSSRYLVFRKALVAALAKKQLAYSDLSNFVAQSPFAIGEKPTGSPYDLGKLVKLRFPELADLLNEAMILHLTTQPFFPSSWEASGLAFSYSDVGVLRPGEYYDPKTGQVLSRN